MISFIIFHSNGTKTSRTLFDNLVLQSILSKTDDVIYAGEKFGVDQAIEFLHGEKSELLNKYGIFGGGMVVNKFHEIINKKLEALGVDPNS